MDLPRNNLLAGALALIALLFFAPKAAQALSCVAPTMDQSVVDGAGVIFEGVAGQTRALNFRENADVRAAGPTTLGGGTIR